ncbi:hypothetical protein [Amycolatopsis sp. NPDC051903]|uniref:hypothetical protein n=1 Tax=Amycolatopsis sp. NPDC051903 TaxID=3363936 RepID=UPI0037B0532C
MTTDSQDSDVEVAPRRAGTMWSAEDTHCLIDGLHNGVPLDTLAAMLQRRESALQARCKQMLLPELQAVVRRRDADVVVREQLATDPDFDAEANLDRNTGRRWNLERDQILREGWEQHRPLGELVEVLLASEIDIAAGLCGSGSRSTAWLWSSGWAARQMDHWTCAAG